MKKIEKVWEVTCNVLVGCVPELVFDGCAPLQRCGRLDLPSLCQFAPGSASQPVETATQDTSACNRSLDGGETCEAMTGPSLEQMLSQMISISIDFIFF